MNDRRRNVGVRRSAWIVAGVAVLWLVSSEPTRAGDPEYLKLRPRVGQALEIKGYLNDDGTFVATDIEELPRPRRPKLRGTVAAIDRKQGTLRLFGMTVRVSTETTFVDEGGDQPAFEKLAVGQRIEVSVKVDDDGSWIARKIRAHGVKHSDKIKGTVTDLSVDGKPPDTLDISGLMILLDRKTDINYPCDLGQVIEDELFGDLAMAGARGSGGAFLLGENVVLDADYRQDLRSQNEFDLSDKFNSDRDDTQQDIRMEATGYWGEKVRTVAQLRFRKRYMIASDQDLSSQAGLIRFTQLFVLAKDVGLPGLAVQIGRQDFDEPREWLFDEYLDALRVYYYGYDPFVAEAAYIVSVEPLKDKFDTWTDYFVRLRWYLDDKNLVSGYYLARRDSDDRNREPVWYGLSYYGAVNGLVRPWLDLALMRGEDKGRSQDAWAIDLGATFAKPDLPLEPSLTLGYAVGSGDEVSGDDVSQEFRQTAYQDNVARLGGVSSLHYYGLVLDPELSNVKIQTLGVAVRPIARGSFELVYHSYRQHRPDNDLKGSDLVDPPARPNGAAEYLGWGLDFVIAPPLFWERLRATLTLGYFSPGGAFAPRQESAFLSKLNLKISL